MRQRITRATEMYVDADLDRDRYEGLCEKARADQNLRGQREVLAQLIEHFTPERVQPGTYRVEITWAATGDLLRRLTAQVAGSAA